MKDVGAVCLSFPLDLLHFPCLVDYFILTVELENIQMFQYRWTAQEVKSCAVKIQSLSIEFYSSHRFLPVDNENHLFQWTPNSSMREDESQFTSDKK